MRAMPARLEAGSQPQLARGVRLRFDRLSARHLLLCPERGLVLNESAAAILAACDGHASVLEIAHRLSRGPDYGSILREILMFLAQLQKRHLIVTARVRA